MKQRLVLGPVPCKACRRFVGFFDGAWRNCVPARQFGFAERQIGGIHRCPALIDARTMRMAAA